MNCFLCEKEKLKNISTGFIGTFLANESQKTMRGIKEDFIRLYISISNASHPVQVLLYNPSHNFGSALLQSCVFDVVYKAINNVMMADYDRHTKLFPLFVEI